METTLTHHERLLLIDTCGETAGVALCSGDVVVATEDLSRGSASAEIMAAIRRLLQDSKWQLTDLHAIGIVAGPGSFTGTRAGLATAKGLCESANLQMASVSRLEVLADAASQTQGFAALDAGRNEVYLREIVTGREWLMAIDDLQTRCQLQPVVIAEPRLQQQLEGCTKIFLPLHVADSLPAVLRSLRGGGSDVALTDANYVRQEADIYRKKQGATA